jgi:CheY-like chemotaxis protein
MMSSLVITLLVTGVIAGAVLALWRARRRRDVDELLLQLCIREILRADRSLAPWPISVSIQLPLWRRSPAVVAIVGRVPSPGLRDAVRLLTMGVMSRRYRRVKTIARIVVDSSEGLSEAPVPARPTTAPDVLLAEDDEASRTGLELLLKRWGYRVETATDGQTAVEKVRALHPWLVITDVAMPRLNGLEVLRVLRRDRPETPVIVLTGQDVAGPLLREAEDGSYGYLSKPVEAWKLRLLVARALAPAEHVAERRPT